MCSILAYWEQIEQSYSFTGDVGACHVLPFVRKPVLLSVQLYVACTCVNNVCISVQCAQIETHSIYACDNLIGAGTVKLGAISVNCWCNRIVWLSLLIMVNQIREKNKMWTERELGKSEKDRGLFFITHWVICFDPCMSLLSNSNWNNCYALCEILCFNSDSLALLILKIIFGDMAINSFYI